MANEMNFPKKNMAAGAMIFDVEERLLVVKPTYKDYWHIPGGVIEKDESPYCTCIREVFEETNLNVIPQELSAVNYTGIIEENIDALVFVFNCGHIMPNSQEIKIDMKEIEDFKFIRKNDIFSYLDDRMAKIIAECLKNIDNHRTIYLDNMIRIL